jgi:nitrite reductase/ring-hydroxylating ferredoxin subunit
MTVNRQLCRLEDIPDGGAVACDILPENGAAQESPLDSIVVLRQNVLVFAYSNVCPHAGRRLDWAPGRFLIEDASLICAAHGAMFNVESGECTAGPCRGLSLTRKPIQIIDGCVVLTDAAG